MADLWYYTCEGKQMEPVSTAELKRLAAEGILRPTDMVWKEGMPRWVRASTAAEIFPGANSTPEPVPAPSAAPVPGAAPPAVIPIPAAPLVLPQAAAPEKTRPEPEPAPRKSARRPDEIDDSPRPRRRRRTENDEDEDRPRRPVEKGTGAGVIVAMCVGGGVLAVALIFAVVVFMYAARPHHQQKQAAVAPLNPGFFPNFAPLEHHDLDIYIIDPVKKKELERQKIPFDLRNKDHVEVCDDAPDQDCNLNWVPPATKKYTVMVMHAANEGRAPQVVVQAKVTITEKSLNGQAAKTTAYDVTLGVGRENSRDFILKQGVPYQFTVKTLSVRPAPPEKAANDPAPVEPPPLPPGVKALGGKEEFANLAAGQEHAFKIQVPAGKAARIHLISYLGGADTKLQLFVVQDDDGKEIARADAPGASHTLFLPAPAATAIYRVRVVNAGVAPTRGAVFFTLQ